MIRIPPKSPYSPSSPEPKKKREIDANFSLPAQLPRQEKPDFDIYELASASLMPDKPEHLSLIQPWITAKIITEFIKGKKLPVEHSKEDEEIKKAIDQFADAYIDKMKENYHNPYEPFNVYAERLRAQIYHNADRFKQRLINGLQILIRETKSF